MRPLRADTVVSGRAALIGTPWTPVSGTEVHACLMIVGLSRDGQLTLSVAPFMCAGSRATAPKSTTHAQTCRATCTGASDSVNSRTFVHTHTSHAHFTLTLHL